MRTLVLIVLLLFSRAANADVLRVAADEWCPYNCSPGSATPGYIIELLSEIYPDSDIDYVLLPWSRAIQMTRTGEYDLIVGAIPIEAPDFIYPKEPAGFVRHTFFTKSNNNWQFTGTSSLYQQRLGIIQDYSYGDTVTRYIRAADRSQVIKAPSLASLIKMMESDRIDTFVEDNAVVKNFVKTQKISTPFREAGLSSEDAIFAAFHPGSDRSQALADQFDLGIRQLRQSGKLSAILETYGLSDWKESAAN